MKNDIDENLRIIKEYENNCSEADEDDTLKI
jgi:hypothetical protein